MLGLWPSSFHFSIAITSLCGLGQGVWMGKGPIILWFDCTWNISPACCAKWSEKETYLSNSDKVEFVLLQMIQIIKFNKYPLSLYYVQGSTTLCKRQL
jgi:hypothetical protein